MGNRVLAHLDSDIVPAHLVRNGGSRTRTQEAVQNQVSAIRSYLQDSFHEAFRFGSVECRNFAEKGMDIFLRLISVADFIGGPPSPRRYAWHLRQISNDVRLRVAFFPE